MDIIDFSLSVFNMKSGLSSLYNYFAYSNLKKSTDFEIFLIPPKHSKVPAHALTSQSLPFCAALHTH